MNKKVHSFAQIFTAIAIGFTTTSQPASAVDTTFFCGIRNGKPTTVARTIRGDIPIIQWASEYFSNSGYSPAKRCTEVSDKFQTYYNNGTLNYLTSGKINRQPVICIAQSPGNSCSEVLFTLEHQDNPNLVLQELLNVRLRATAAPITRGGSQEAQPLYIDFKNYLITAPVEKRISPISQSSAAQPDNSNNDTNRGNSRSPSLENMLRQMNPSQSVMAMEQTWEGDYEKYFKANLSEITMNTEGIAAALGKLANQTGKKPALIYAAPTSRQLELVLILPQQQPIRKRIVQANKANLMEAVKELQEEIGRPSRINTNSYLPAAKQLHQWLISPIETELKNNQIDTLIFCVGSGLRSLPIAALYDGQKFLVEKYSIGLIPAFNMMNISYRDIKNLPVLAMGASQFKDQAPLAAVPVEVNAIMQDLSGILWPGPWRGKSFLNQEFTVDNLRSQRAKQSFGIVHLATHAEFKPGIPANSYIQFWDTKVGLDKMRQLQWNNPLVELLVLSACRTAVGDKDAEMGFAGLAVQSGVKSALASLWNVSDEGTLALMTEFYQQLRVAPIKAEALRQAQIAMIRGQLRIENGKLVGPMLTNGISLPPQLAELGNTTFSHPYYWAAFTMIGNPW